VHNSGADLAFDVVSDNGKAGAAEFPGPVGVRCDKHRNAIDHGHTGFQASPGIMVDRRFRANRHVADQNLGLGVLEGLDDIDWVRIGRAEGLIIWIVGHMWRHTVENGSHLYDDVGYRQGGMENRGAVGFGENCLFHPLAHLAPVNIKSGHDFDIARPPITDPGMHEAGKRPVVPSLVIFQSLDKRTCAIANPGDGHPDFSHANSLLINIVPKTQRLASGAEKDIRQRTHHCWRQTQDGNVLEDTTGIVQTRGQPVLRLPSPTFLSASRIHSKSLT